MTKPKGSKGRVDGLVGAVRRIIGDIDEAWAEAKTLGVDIQHVIDAVERGLPLATVMTALREAHARGISGGRIDHYLRYLRIAIDSGPPPAESDADETE